MPPGFPKLTSPYGATCSSVRSSKPAKRFSSTARRRHRDDRDSARQGIRRESAGDRQPRIRCRICCDLGAERAIDYKQEDFVEIVRQEGGANVILDIVGGPNIERNFKAAAHDARIIQLAFALGSKVEVNLMPVMLKAADLHRVDAEDPPFRVQGAHRARARGASLASRRKRPHPVVTHRIFPLGEAAEAHRTMESAGHVGKILLSPKGSNPRLL